MCQEGVANGGSVDLCHSCTLLGCGPLQRRRDTVKQIRPDHAPHTPTVHQLLLRRSVLQVYMCCQWEMARTLLGLHPWRPGRYVARSVAAEVRCGVNSGGARSPFGEAADGRGADFCSCVHRCMRLPCNPLALWTSATPSICGVHLCSPTPQLCIAGLQV